MTLRTRFFGLVHLFTVHVYALNLLFILSSLLMFTGTLRLIISAELHTGSHAHLSITSRQTLPYYITE